MITEKFNDLFDFGKKSKIKAGDGLREGLYPFYTSSAKLSKRIDVFQEDKISLIFDIYKYVKNILFIIINSFQHNEYNVI